MKSSTISRAPPSSACRRESQCDRWISPSKRERETPVGECGEGVRICKDTV